jgi:hypothetical protein
MTSPVILLEDSAAAILVVGALGTASFGFLDATKAVKGGASRLGFGYIEAALGPYMCAIRHDGFDAMPAVWARWLNGVAMSDQKAAVKDAIWLGARPQDADDLANTGPVEGAALADILRRLRTGAALTAAQTTLHDRFDHSIDAALDAGFERADQAYRNSCKLLAGLVAVILAVAIGWVVDSLGVFTAAKSGAADYWTSPRLAAAILIGLVSVPIGPIAKDLASTLQAAAAALPSAKPAAK